MKYYEYILIPLYVVLAYFINKLGLNIVSIAIFSISIIITIIKLDVGLKLFFINSLAFSDFIFENMYLEGLDTMPLGGIYMASLAGNTLMVYWCLFLTVIIFFKKNNEIVYLFKRNLFFKILLIILIASLLGLSFNLLKGGEYVLLAAISDLRFFINIFVGFFCIYFIVSASDNINNEIKKYFNIFILIFITQVSISIISSYTLSQSTTLYNFVTGTESYLIGIVFLYILFKFSEKKATSERVLLIFLLILLIAYIFISAARGRIFLLILSLVVFCIYTKKYNYIIIAPLVILIAYQAVNYINPNFMNYFLWKFTTFNPLGEGGDSATVRYISFINILGESIANPYYFIFGKGFGGYFETIYADFPFDLTGRTAFKQEWIIEGKYYKPHGMLLFSLLKFGVLMSFVLFLSIIRLCYIQVKQVGRSYSLSSIVLTISLTLPIFFTVIYSSKLQILFGMLLGFIYVCSMDININKLQNERNISRGTFMQ